MRETDSDRDGLDSRSTAWSNFNIINLEVEEGISMSNKSQGGKALERGEEEELMRKSS